MFFNKRKKLFQKKFLLGEHYTEVCPSLKRFIDNELKLDIKYFGYMEYAYGLEEHRQFFKELIIRDHQLDEKLTKDDWFEVGCFMNSTRLLMFDLGRFILKEFEEKNEKREGVVCKYPLRSLTMNLFCFDKSVI